MSDSEEYEIQVIQTQPICDLVSSHCSRPIVPEYNVDLCCDTEEQNGDTTSEEASGEHPFINNIEDDNIAAGNSVDAEIVRLMENLGIESRSDDRGRLTAGIDIGAELRPSRAKRVYPRNRTVSIDEAYFKSRAMDLGAIKKKIN